MRSQLVRHHYRSVVDYTTERASRLDADSGLSPVSSLRVVSVNIQSASIPQNLALPALSKAINGPAEVLRIKESRT
jgi:hypothetical protein